MFVRTLHVSLVAFCLLPLAAARPDLPDPSGDQLTVGPCAAGWSMYWPGETVGARCEADGHVVAASYGSCALGNYIYLRVDRYQSYQPCDATLMPDTTLP